ncbi:MAG: DUF4115 domain-containing protein [Desulfobacterales bacterium]|nr:DUF4115 domain-containing protein [Desulfobacterales bacterium]
MHTNRFNPDLIPVSCGRYIKAIRVQMRIDLQTVSEALGVSLHQLHLIESEDHEELTDEDFVKDTLRAYAHFIGIDAEDIIDRFEIGRAAYTSGRRAGQKKLGLGAQNLKRALLTVCLLAGISLLLMTAFYGWQSFSGGDERRTEAPSASSPKTAAAAPVAEESAAESLVLTIDAIEKTWIEINMDGQEQLKYLLSPKDHVELEAGKYYHMLIGNAAGLKIKLNGEPVDIPGNRGEVITLELP